MARRWPRDAYVRAVWASDLPTLPRIVALAYGDHAARGDAAWVALPRLMAVTGIRSKTSVHNAVKVLVDAGWLELVEKGRQHRASRYRIVIPEGAQGYVSRTAGADSSGTSADSSGTSRDASGTSRDASGTSRGTDYSEDCSEDAAPRPAVVGDLDELLRSLGREAS